MALEPVDSGDTILNGSLSDRVVVVVPCYNEAKRFDAAAFVSVANPRFILVDDGSTDDTLNVLNRAMAQCPERLSVLALPRNAGKAEAVRRGMLEALSQGADTVGYLDADGATPVGELAGLHATLHGRHAQVVLGSRVMLLGHTVRRSAWRHYVGRLLATVASSFTLRIPVYDTQCGAKLFRVSPALREALATPFVSRWVFDVELLGRLLHPVSAPAIPVEALVEVPLRQWIDAPGSKVRFRDGVRALIDLVKLGLQLRRAR